MLLGLAAAVGSWLRLPADVRGVVWAEDGAIFLQHWLDGSGGHLLTPYDGYLHLVPRALVGTAAALAPPASFALVLTAACCAVVGVLTGVVYVCAGDVVRSEPARCLIAAITALAPAAGTEVLGNAANLHWYFLWATPWILLYRPRCWTVSVLLAAVVLVGSLTEIQTALFLLLLPLALLHRRSWPIALALVGGVGAQVATTLASPRTANLVPEPSALSVSEGFLVSPVLSTVTGRWSVQGDVVTSAGWWAPALLLAVVVALGVVAVVRGDLRRRVAVATCTVTAGAVWAGGVVINPSSYFDFDTYTSQQWADYGSPRYAVVPAMFLVAAAVLGADALLRSSRARGVVLGRLVLVVAVAALVLNAVPALTVRSGMTRWEDALGVATRQCERGAETVTIAGVPAAFAVWASCQRLARWEE